MMADMWEKQRQELQRRYERDEAAREAKRQEKKCVAYDSTAAPWADPHREAYCPYRFMPGVCEGCKYYQNYYGNRLERMLRKSDIRG